MNSENLHTISIVVPVFRNEETLVELYSALKKISLTLSYEFRFIFVNDGSDDRSEVILRELAQSDKTILVLTLSRNFGQVAAIFAGLNECEGDATIIMSADLQEPVNLIPKMISAWKEGSEIVIANRTERSDGLFSRATSSFFYSLIRYSNPGLPEGGFDFVLLGRNAVAALKKIKNRNRFLQGDILWLGFETRFIPYEREPRLKGKSQWSFSKKIKYLLDGIFSTSYWPIRMMSLLGFSTAFSGFVYILIIVYMRIMHQTPFNGWAPIMVVMLFLGGVIMIMLGITGEYLWRIYDEVRGRPEYIVKKKISGDEDSNRPD